MSAIFALAAVISRHGHVGIPVVSPHEFDARVLAFAVPTAGVLMCGA